MHSAAPKSARAHILKQYGGLTVEFGIAMIIAAAIILPTLLLFLDTSRGVINAFIGWILQSYP